LSFNPDNPAEERKHQAKVRHVLGSVDVVPDRLAWSKPDKFHQLTTCGNYSVAKAYVHRVPSYSAWHRPDANPAKIPLHLGEYATPELARTQCQLHRDGKVVRKAGEVMR
jgi:hypothetical protein